jgi:hypothetical protein
MRRRGHARLPPGCRATCTVAASQCAIETPAGGSTCDRRRADAPAPRCRRGDVVPPVVGFQGDGAPGGGKGVACWPTRSSTKPMSPTLL